MPRPIILIEAIAFVKMIEHILLKINLHRAPELESSVDAMPTKTYFFSRHIRRQRGSKLFLNCVNFTYF